MFFNVFFVITNIHKPIIGANFLHHFGLLVNMKRPQLVDKVIQMCVEGICALDPSPSPSITPQYNNCYLWLLSDFPELTQLCSADTPARHDITHHIMMSGPPVSARPRRLAPEHLRVARQESEQHCSLLIQYMVISTTHGAKKFHYHSSLLPCTIYPLLLSPGHMHLL